MFESLSTLHPSLRTQPKQPSLTRREKYREVPVRRSEREGAGPRLPPSPHTPSDGRSTRQQGVKLEAGAMCEIDSDDEVCGVRGGCGLLDLMDRGGRRFEQPAEDNAEAQVRSSPQARECRAEYPLLQGGAVVKKSVRMGCVR